MVRTAMKQRDKLEKDIADLEKTIRDQKAKVGAKVWTLSLQEIGPKALQTVTGFAKEQRLKLTAFRPQKPNDVNGMTQLPFLISIEGSYPSILNFIRQIETSNSKLAPNLVQLSSTDGSSDLVTATIGVMAYTLPAPPEKSSPKKTQEKVNATQKEN
jgi:Tfp pilus assembly protein PilO